MPAMPDIGTLVQVSVYVMMELLLGGALELDDEITAELDMNTTDELLNCALELDPLYELELPKGQELLTTPPEGHSRKGPVVHIPLAIKTQ